MDRMQKAVFGSLFYVFTKCSLKYDIIILDKTFRGNKVVWEATLTLPKMNVPSPAKVFRRQMNIFGQILQRQRTAEIGTDEPEQIINGFLFCISDEILVPVFLV